MRRALASFTARVLVLVTFAALLGLTAAGTSWGHNPHKVTRGQSVSGIAHAHHTTVKRLRKLNPRKLRNPGLIFTGDTLRTHGKAKHKPKPKRHPRIKPCNRRVWPVPGRTVYTYPGHDGVDINRGAGWDDYGDPIRSVSCGRVSYVGWNRGYGDAIFVRLPKGKEVVYGHTSKQFVHSGQRVRAGRLIGRVGNTGNSTAPHLHFGFPGGTFNRALDYLLGGGAGGIDPVLDVKQLSPEQAAAFDGIGVDQLGGPRKGAPWSAWWNRIAECESSKRWHVNTGNGYYGGLQFFTPTWLGYGGGRFAPRADLATKHQQKRVAERVFHGPQGLGAWPVCGIRGVR